MYCDCCARNLSNYSRLAYHKCIYVAFQQASIFMECLEASMCARANKIIACAIRPVSQHFQDRQLEVSARKVRIKGRKGISNGCKAQHKRLSAKAGNWGALIKPRSGPARFKHAVITASLTSRQVGIDLQAY